MTNIWDGEERRKRAGRRKCDQHFEVIVDFANKFEKVRMELHSLKKDIDATREIEAAKDEAHDMTRKWQWQFFAIVGTVILALLTAIGSLVLFILRNIVNQAMS